jgi:hypothetical protein
VLPLFFKERMMPNHVWTNLEVNGCPADIAVFKANFCEAIDGVEHCLVFNRVIPMPEELNITCGSDTNIGREVVAGNYKTVLAYPWVIKQMQDNKLSPAEINAMHHSREQFLDWFAKHKPEVIELGKKVVTNIANHGYPTWYEWRIATWGTKWDAYSHKPGDNNADTVYSCYFETAWSPAFPILKAMSHAFPDLSFRMAYADEGGGFAGVAHCDSDGFVDEASDYRQICMDEFGHSEEDFDDDDDDELDVVNATVEEVDVHVAND